MVLADESERCKSDENIQTMKSLRLLRIDIIIIYLVCLLSHFWIKFQLKAWYSTSDECHIIL